MYPCVCTCASRFRSLAESKTQLWAGKVRNVTLPLIRGRTFLCTKLRHVLAEPTDRPFSAYALSVVAAWDILLDGKPSSVRGIACIPNTIL